jgi:hypothetical protein
MCEDWSTVSIFQALERHSAKHGVPSQLFIDSGSQLLKIKDMSFNVIDLTKMLQSRLSCTVVTATPKSHENQGRVERKIGQIKDLLDRMNGAKFLLSFLGWETVLARIANHLNNLPICRPSGKTVQNPEFDLLTPNRLLIGRNNVRALSGPLIIDSTPSSVLQRICEVEQSFFALLIKTAHLYIPKSKWFSSDAVFINDIVLFFIEEPKFQRSSPWHYARVKGINGKRLTLEYTIGNSKSKKLIERSKRQVIRIANENELDFNSRSHFQDVLKLNGITIDCSV